MVPGTDEAGPQLRSGGRIPYGGHHRAVLLLQKAHTGPLFKILAGTGWELYGCWFVGRSRCPTPKRQLDRAPGGFGFQVLSHFRMCRTLFVSDALRPYCGGPVNLLSQ
jgi:hypothetical protein